VQTQVRAWIEQFARACEVDTSAWQVRCSDIDCVISGIASHCDALSMSAWLRDRGGAEPLVLPPSRFMVSWSVSALVTIGH
jgi:hypothetical protein